jgi:hypothetical protein
VNRRVLAFTLLAVVTALMWSDTVIEWWQSTIEFFLRVNEGVTESVLDSRPGNDVDLHVLVWAATSLVFVWAFRAKWWAVLVALFFWSALVETLQPAFTEIRSRQLADYVGNAIGVAVVALLFALIGRSRSVNQPSSPAR